MELALEAVQGLVKNRGFLTEELVHLFTHLVVVLERLNCLKGLVHIDLKSLNLFLMHLDFLFNRHFSLV